MQKIKEDISKGKTLKERLSLVKKVTAGQLFKNGSCLVGKDVFEIASKKHRAKLAATKKLKDKNKNKVDKLRAEVVQIKLLRLAPEKMNGAQLRSMVSYYKKKGDGALPTLKKHLLELYKKMMSEGRQSPLCSPNTTDNEGSDDENDSDDDTTCDAIVAV